MNNNKKYEFFFSKTNVYNENERKKQDGDKTTLSKNTHFQLYNEFHEYQTNSIKKELNKKNKLCIHEHSQVRQTMQYFSMKVNEMEKWD